MLSRRTRQSSQPRPTETNLEGNRASLPRVKASGCGRSGGCARCAGARRPDQAVAAGGARRRRRSPDCEPGCSRIDSSSSGRAAASLVPAVNTSDQERGRLARIGGRAAGRALDRRYGRSARAAVLACLVGVGARGGLDIGGVRGHDVRRWHFGPEPGRMERQLPRQLERVLDPLSQLLLGNVGRKRHHAPSAMRGLSRHPTRSHRVGHASRTSSTGSAPRP